MIRLCGGAVNMNINLLLCETHHVVPEGTSHHCLCPLAEMEAICTKEGAVRAAILNSKIRHSLQLGQFIDSVRKHLTLLKL